MTIELLYPLPTAGTITQTFHEHTWGNKGLDIADDHGTQLLAAFRAKVVREGYDADGYGYYIRLKSIDDPVYEVLYAHMAQPSPLSVGDTVEAGRVIGLMDSTGRSTGSHVHFELIQNGARIDPAPFLCAAGQPIPNDPHTIPQLPTIPPELLSAVYHKVRILASPFVNVRKGAGTSYPLAGSISRGDTVEVMRALTAGGDIWLQVDGRGWWVAMVYGGEALAEWVEE